MMRLLPFAAAVLAAAATVARAGPATPSAEACRRAADYSEQCQGQAIVVMHDGKVVFERYANGGAAAAVQMLASASKSLVGLAAAAAVEDGLIALDDPASRYIADWHTDAAKQAVTLRQLLSLTSGLTPGERGNAVHAPSWGDIAAKPMTGRPGAQFEYGAYHVNVFAYALENALKARPTEGHGVESFEAYLKRRILDPMKVKVEWRFRCDDGHPQVGGGAFMTTRDFARVGEMVCAGGTLDGITILKPASLAPCFVGSKPNSAYGLTWWLKRPVDAATLRAIPLLSREWGAVANSKTLPDDLVAACGAGKQRLYVVPSMKLVVARQGRLARDFDDVHFLDLLLTPRR